MFQVVGGGVGHSGGDGGGVGAGAEADTEGDPAARLSRLSNHHRLTRPAAPQLNTSTNRKRTPLRALKSLMFSFPPFRDSRFTQLP